MDNKSLIQELETEREGFLKIANDAISKVKALDITIEIYRGKRDLDKLVPSKNNIKNDIIKDDTPIIDGTPLEIAINIIKKSDRFLVKHEICKIADEILGTKNFKDKLKSALGIEAGKENNKSGLVKRQIGESYNNTVWGFSEWIDENGKIKREKMFNVEALPFKVSTSVINSFKQKE